MLNIIKVILFIIVNIAGWYTISVVASVAIKMDVFPQFTPGSVHAETFKLWFLGGGMWVWIACALTSISYFFLENEWKNWLLLAPMFIPAAYGTAVLIYFNFIYTIG